jgi:hypothetical protein
MMPFAVEFEFDAHIRCASAFALASARAQYEVAHP